MIGLLNDKGMNDAGVMVARIDDKPYEVLSYVLPFLEKLEKGAQVEVFTNKDGKISKIFRAKIRGEAEISREHETYNARARGTPTDKPGETDIAGDAVDQAKRRAAGFGQPANNQDTEKCTSPDKPAGKPGNGLKTVEGQITAINYDKRGLAVRDKGGDTHPFYWSENFKMVNYKGELLKQWWFVRITAERRESDDTWWVTAQEYFKKPDDWPKPQGGKGQYQPRNEKLIVAQMLTKCWSDLYIHSNPPDDLDFDKGREDILAAMEQDIDRVMKAGGA
jgi:hypothetical protein